MEHQQDLLDFSIPLHPDSASEKNVDVPLNEGAKKLCKCGCGQKIIFKPHHKYRDITHFIQGHHNTLYGKIKYKSIIISNEIEQILIGGLLGDGSLSKKSKISSVYTITHSTKQEEYLIWKVNILNLPHSLNKRKKQLNYKGQEKIYFIVDYRTKNLPQLNKYFEMFYFNGRKVVTQEILNKLELLGIAIWYMDDGHYSYYNKNITLCTNCFSLEEHKLIQKWFKEKYSLNWQIIKNNSLYSLRLNTKEIKNEDKIRIKKADYYRRNKDKIIKKTREYYSKNKEKMNQVMREYYQKNKTIWWKYRK